jgi:cell division protein ZapD
MKDRHVYEQPFSEKVRTWLRAEMLFNQMDYFLSQPSRWDARAAIHALLDLQQVLTRTDMKPEMIADLERQQSALLRLRDNPEVDGKRLGIVLEKVDSLRLLLITPDKDRAHPSVRHDDFLSAIRQRASIPGGTCDFDLPLYSWWLNQAEKPRRAMLRSWLDQFSLQRRAITTLLLLLREGAIRTRHTAASGYYQRVMDSAGGCQLVRVFLAPGSIYYPEISGGKQRFTVRFLMVNDLNSRPVQIADDVQFEIACCTQA